MATRLEREVVEEEEPSPGWAERTILVVGDWFPGLFRPLVLLAAVLAVLIGLGVMGLALFLLALGAVISAFPVGGMGLIIYAHGVAFLLTGQVALLHDSLADMESKKWTPFILLGLAPMAALMVYLHRVGS